MEDFIITSRKRPEIQCIYSITNIETNKKYIGSTVNLKNRIKKHREELNNNRHHSKHLQNSYNIYGKDKFLVHVEETIECKEDLKLREKYYIELYDSLNNGYNCCEINSFPEFNEKSISKIKEHSKSTFKSVYSINRFTGEKDGEFESVSSAFNTTSGNISGVCKGRINYMKDHVFVYSSEYDEFKDYSFKCRKPVILTDLQKETLRDNNSKAKPVFKYDLNGNLITKFSSRHFCEISEMFKVDFLRYTLTKYKIVKVYNYIYSTFEILENFTNILSTIYVKDNK